MKNIRKKLGYYFFASYRRKLLDKLLEKHRSSYAGIVLDIGGRDRGIFRSPKESVEKWITADIEKERHPDMLLDVCNMIGVKSESIDTINALELFEHVSEPEIGLRECARVLKKGGLLLISMPFLYPLHADPNDFQRWTREKWERSLADTGFETERIEAMGGFFTVFSEMIRYGNLQCGPLKYIGFVFYPLLDTLSKIDTVVKKKPLKNHTTGYFIIAKKA